MGRTFPLRVLLMDDDFYALKLNTTLLMRDLRTTVCGEAGTPKELLRQAAGAEAPDAIVLDTEYIPPEPPLGALIVTLRTMVPDTAIVCLSQYGDPSAVRAAASAGARGFLLKGEVGLAIGAAVTRACRASFVTTPGVEAALRGEFDDLLNSGDRLRPWQPNPRLTAQQLRMLWLCVVYGMSARQAAEEVGNLEPGTVEKYVNTAYRVLYDDWFDDTDLDGIDLDALKAEDRAFLLFTAPPRGEGK